MDVCRACLLTSTEQYSVFDDLIRAGFEELAGIIVSPTDSMPHTVCADCMSHINGFMQFKSKILTSNEYLIEALKEVQVIQTVDNIHEIKADDVPEIKVEPTFMTPEFEMGDSGHFSEIVVSDTIVIEKKHKKVKKKKCKIKKKEDEKKVTTKKPRAFIEIDPTKIRVTKLSLEEQLRDHLLESKKPAFLAMPYKCQLCYKGFNYERKLKAHEERYHKPDAVYRCPVCARTLGGAASLALHALRHARRYACAACGAVHADKARAVAHRRAHDADAPPALRCARCGKTFRHRSTLNGHIRNHHVPANRRQCQLCHKEFVSQDSLDDHMLIHSGVKEHACVACGARFRLRGALAAHARRHAAAPAHAHRCAPAHAHRCAPAHAHRCARCDAAFKTRASYRHHLRHSKRHLALADPSSPEHTCARCGRACATAAALRAHAPPPRRDAPRNFVCHACARQFASRRTLDNHVRAHAGGRPGACARAAHSGAAEHTRDVDLS